MAGRAQPLPLLDHCLRTVNSPLGTSTRHCLVALMEAQATSFPLAFPFPSIPYFGPYLPGRTCSISLVSSLYLTLPYSPSSFFSGWLPLSLPSYRSPSVPSKNYALSEVNIRFTREQNASTGIRVSARLLFLFFFFLPFLWCFMHVHSFAYACFCIYAWAKCCSPRPVIEDFGREWECHVDEWN